MSTTTLHRMLQSAGFDSRRRIRRGIADGEFTVNGKTVTDPNFPVEPGHDEIRFQGRRLKLNAEPLVYFLLNKPRGVVSTLSDPGRRPTIKDLIRGIPERVYPVGRLDYNSEGLILLTNDGALMKKVITPSSRVPKQYLVKIRGELSETDRRRLLEKGVHLEGIRVRPLEITFIRRTAQGHSWLTITITEGHKHVVRKLLQYAGHPVERLRRLAIGSLKLKGIPVGHWREATEPEIKAFSRELEAGRKVTGNRKQETGEGAAPSGRPLKRRK